MISDCRTLYVFYVGGRSSPALSSTRNCRLGAVTMLRYEKFA